MACYPFFILILTSMISLINASDCNKQGNITTQELQDNPFVLKSDCNGSYFQISTPNLNDGDVPSEFIITILETIDENEVTMAKMRIDSSGENMNGASLASKSSEVSFWSSPSPPPPTIPAENFTIQYKEINQSHVNTPIDYGEGQIILDPQHADSWKPNEQRKYSFQSKLNVQKFDLSWNFSSESSTNSALSASSSFGFIAIRNSNGKISLVSGPSGSHLKFAIGMPKRSISNFDDSGDSTIDIITQNDPEASTYHESKRRIILDYKLGQDFNITTSTTTTTQKVPTKDDGIHIFILPVNEMVFYTTYFDEFVQDLTDIADAERCKLLKTDAMSCRDECFMSDNPDRGCLGVIVGLIHDPLICKMTQDDFKERIEAKISSDWLKKYGVNRIELDDCLASQQKIWIITGVAFIVFALGVFIISFVAIKLFQRNKQKKQQYGRLSDSSIDRQISSSTKANRNQPYTQPSHFEDL